MLNMILPLIRTLIRKKINFFESELSTTIIKNDNNLIILLYTGFKQRKEKKSQTWNQIYLHNRVIERP
jgi:hypothetical protein